FGKSPRRSMAVCPPLFLTCLFTVLGADVALTNMCQIFQADETVWVPRHDPTTDHMVGILLQPSLSSAHDNQSSRSGASAFLLQPFLQSCIVVSFSPKLFARIESRLILGGSRHSQVTLTHIHACDRLVSFRGGFCDFDLKRDKQVKLFV